jgi:hypothetical protein
MNLKKFLTLFLLASILFPAVRSQVVTNLSALRAGELRSQAEYQQMQTRLATIAAQKGWRLVIPMKNGGKAILNGISPQGMPLYIGPNDNIISAQTIGTNQLWPGGSTGLNLNGSTAAMKGKIAVWDEGRVLATHQELAGRILQFDNPPALSDHSTHVSGTMIAAGVNPLAKGMSFGALQLQTYVFNNDLTEMYAAAPNLLISNHSYGAFAGWNPETDGSWTWYGITGDTVDYKFGYYDPRSQVWDSISYNAPFYLIVHSAGNNRGYNGPAVGQPYFGFNSSGNRIPEGNRPAGISSNNGWDILPTESVAKNPLLIGAVNPIPGGYNSPADVVIADFSSIGPTDDGRIKPDLVADGVNVLSSVSTSNTAYAVFSGTSMSSPAAAGSGFLLQEEYYKLHNSFMRSATLKGILIHSADEAGPADGPDYIFGYGLIDMPKAAAVISSNNTDQLIEENTLTTTDGTFNLPVVASGKGPLIVTICWTDPAGPVDLVNVLNNPARKLVNDLDVRVTGNGNTYMPWVLNRLSPGSPATHGDDTLNNVEKIVIPNAVPGKSYNISVTHKGTLLHGTQAYSLIVSGVGGTGYCTSAATNSAGTRIDQVSIANINAVNPPGCTTYTDNTSQTINLESGQSIPFTIKLSSCDATNASRVVKIFVDYNNNGTFTDPGETAAVSAVLPGGAVSFTGNLAVPTGLQFGNITRLRIVAEETTDTAAVLPCGNYPNGETQDYNATYVHVANDVTVNAIVDPLSGSCQADSQRVSINIRNLGINTQSSIPIHLKVISGNTTLVDETTVYPNVVTGLQSAVYTFQAPFNLTAGSTYIIQANTLLPADENPGNDAISDTITVSKGSGIPSGEAEICSTNPALAGLRANTPDSSDAAFWYDSPTATTPIATGSPANTTDIPSDKTYYLGLNELTGTIGPKNKLVYPAGGYNLFNQNFIRFHNDVPVTIASTRLYVASGGKVSFVVSDLNSFDSCSGDYTATEDVSTTIDVYPTTPNPSKLVSSINSPADTGAVFLLNLPVTTPGDHILIVQPIDSVFLFRNNGITSPIYPMGLPGIFTITGNSAVDPNNCKDTSFYQQYYYFYYDMRITLNNCASPRVPVVAKTPAPAVVTRIGNLLSSNYASGNQWYFNDTLIAGATNQTDTLFNPGSYKVVVNDSVGCTLVSNEYVYTPGNDIGLIVSPNPNNGLFNVRFYLTTMANADLRVLDITGQQLYEAQYPNFQGSFSKTIGLGAVSAGMYVLQLEVGGKKYIQKVMVY